MLCCRFFSREILKVFCILKPVTQSGNGRIDLYSFKCRVVYFQAQNKIVLLSVAPPVHRHFFARARTDLI